MTRGQGHPRPLPPGTPLLPGGWFELLAPTRKGERDHTPKDVIRG